MIKSEQVVDAIRTNHDLFLLTGLSKLPKRGTLRRIRRSNGLYQNKMLERVSGMVKGAERGRETLFGHLDNALPSVVSWFLYTLSLLGS